MSAAEDVNHAGCSSPLKESSNERPRGQPHPNLQVLEKNSPVVYYEND